jgi:phasin family protein
MPSLPTNPALRSGLDVQLNFLTELTRRTGDAMRKLNELHLQYAQHLMQDATDASHTILACTDPFQALAAVARTAKPAAEHVRNYQQQLVNVLSGVQLELVRSAESFAPEASRYASAMAENLARDTAQAVSAFGPRGNGAQHSPG